MKILNPVVVKESKKIDNLLYDIWLNRLSRDKVAMNALSRRLDSNLGYPVTNTLKAKCSELGIKLINGHLMNRRLKNAYNKLVVDNDDKIEIEHLLGGIAERIKFIKSNKWSDDEIEGPKQIREYLLNFNFAIHRENRYKKNLNQHTPIDEILNYIN